MAFCNLTCFLVISMLNMKFSLFSILLVCLLPNAFWGQKVLPPIYNYKIFDYKAASQNWDIAVDSIGALYSANNKGLLYYNGEEWILNKLPNSTIIRSVRVIGEIEFIQDLMRSLAIGRKMNSEY